MKIPMVIDKLFIDIYEEAATTIVLSDWDGVIYRYKERPNTIIDQQVRYKISYPMGWTLNSLAGKIKILREKELADSSARILVKFENPDDISPKLYLLVETMQVPDFLNYLYMKINDWKKIYLKVDCLSEEFFNVATIRLQQSIRGCFVFHVIKYIVNRDRLFSLVVSDLSAEQFNERPNLAEDIKYIAKSLTFID